MSACLSVIKERPEALCLLLKEALVDSHELSDERLHVVDCFLAELQPVLVVSRHLCDVNLQLGVDAADQLVQQALKQTVQAYRFQAHYLLLKTEWIVTDH